MKRSTVDHISSLTNIIETRKKQKKATFCAFIDFKKAYDTINRTKLWHRLGSTGLCGKLFRAVKSLYSSVYSCVRLNNLHTDWFEVNSGLRQGCILSPLMFNLYINDLAVYLKSLGIGVACDDDTVCLLMYADDIVLLAETENDLQTLIGALNDWCRANDMVVNNNKSNIIHFRNPSIERTNFKFQCGASALTTVDRYTYLGLLLTEHLDFELTAKFVAQSASRALGLLISKCKLAGGLPFNVFSKLYDSVVYPVISYGASIWGNKSYSCINAVQNKAMRFFLGVGKYTPVAAVEGDMGWEPSLIRQWSSIGRHLTRISRTPANRINKRIALWAHSKASHRCRNWFYTIKDRLSKLNLNTDYDINNPIGTDFVENLRVAGLNKFKTDWKDNIRSEVGPSRRGRNKLRTYCLFKSIYETEAYCKIMLPIRHRSAFAKFRCGVAPLRIETGRYENRLLEDRICPFCDEIESEVHVLFNCHLYDDFRNELFRNALNVNHDFNVLSLEDKLIFLFSNLFMIRFTAKTCFNILQTEEPFI